MTPFQRAIVYSIAPEGSLDLQAFQKQKRANFEKGVQAKDKEAQETIKAVDAELSAIQAEYTSLVEKLFLLEAGKLKLQNREADLATTEPTDS